MKRILLFLNVLLLALLPVAAAGCAPAGESGEPFDITVYPDALKGNAIPGQRIVFLVIVKDSAAGGAAIAISAQAPGAKVSVNPKTIKPGQVAEVTVIPAAAQAGKSLEVTISGRRGGLTDQEKSTCAIIEGKDDRREYATELLGKFTSWLAANHPELGIDASTRWTGTMVSPQWLIVSHYLFFSEKWELHIEWHVMVAPHDWARIDLRRRDSETRPSHAFEISSLKGGTAPITIAVPATAWR